MIYYDLKYKIYVFNICTHDQFHFKRSFVSLRQYEHTKIITLVYIYNEIFDKISQLEVPVASL